MNIGSLDLVTKNQLAQEYRAAGLVVLPAVELPESFAPPVSDIVFLKLGESCEVHIDSSVTYLGPVPAWRDAQARAEGPGGTRFVTAVRGDFLSALHALGGMLQEQVEPPASHRRADVPRPVAPVRPTLPASARDRLTLRNLVEEQRAVARSFVGREEALVALKTNLVRESKPGVVILGPPGIGKTSLVAALAWDIAQSRNVPRAIRDVPVFDVPLGSLVENSQMVGDIEQKARRVFEQRTPAVFFLDEIHQLARPELSPLRDLLKPALAAGTLRVIGATTPLEWRKVDDPAFKRRFIELHLGPPSPREVSEMLRERKLQIGRHHELHIDELTANEAIMLADRYLPLRNFPDKAIDVIDQACAMQILDRSSGARASTHLDRDHVLRAVAAQSGVEAAALDPLRQSALIDEVAARLHASFHGQQNAITTLTSTLQAQLALRRLGWSEAVRELKRTSDSRPLASFLACGPTGTGKSGTARRLAQELFGGNLIVLNGNDVGPEAAHGTAMWAGSPPGYVGSQSGGTLTNALRTRASTVILIDEIEKASPEAIQNVVLGVLDGQVTDRNDGSVLHTHEAIVFATTNLRVVPEQLTSLGFASADRDAVPVADSLDVFGALAQHLWPEVLGRFNAILVYQPLHLASMWSIWTDLQQQTERRIGNGTELALDELARRFLEAHFLGIQTGARGVQDVFRQLMLPLFMRTPAGSAPSITVRDGRLAFVDTPSGT